MEQLLTKENALCIVILAVGWLMESVRISGYERVGPWPEPFAETGNDRLDEVRVWMVAQESGETVDIDGCVDSKKMRERRQYGV